MNKERYVKKLKGIDWTQLYESKNINEINEMFVETIRKILEGEAPMKTKQVRKNYACWMDENLTSMRIIRDNLRELACTTKNENDWSNFRKYKNKYNRALIRTKTEYYRKMFEGLGERKGYEKHFQ